MKNTRPITLTTAIVIMLLFTMALQSCKNADGQQQGGSMPAVPVITLGANAATTWQDYTAAIQGKTDVAIRPQVSGYLDHIYVDEGAYVSAGQPLFRIDEQPYREQLNNAVANQHATEAAVIAAQLEVDKITPLVQNKVVSDVQLKTAQATYKMAVARAEQAKAAAGTARINMGYAVIKAPSAGFIGRLPYKKGSLVGSADPMPLTTLSDVREVHAYFSMSEIEFINFTKQYPVNDSKKLPPATLILANNEAYAQQGKVDMIDGQFDKTTGAITIRATFPNNNGILRSGNTAKIRINQQFSDVLLVPQQATVEMQDKVFIYTLDDKNKIIRKPIVIAGKTGTDYIVKEGIDKGTRIVYSGLDKLKDGIEVKPLAATPVTASR